MSSTAAFKAEFEWLIGEVKKVKTEVTISHGDPWWTNIVYNKRNGECYVGCINYELG